MSSRPAEQTATQWIHAPLINADNGDRGAADSRNPSSDQPATGAIDISDDYSPEDEHEGENEAAQHETSDAEEAPEEFQRDNEDPRGP
jgi:hypothetical protein